MESIKAYFEQLRTAWLQFGSARLIKVLRDQEITDDQALERLNAYVTTRGILRAVTIPPIRLHKNLSRVIEGMNILGIKIPLPDEAVNEFLRTGELP